MPAIWNVLRFHYILTLLLLKPLEVARAGSAYIMYSKKYLGDLVIRSHFSWQAEGLETEEFGQRPRLSHRAAAR